MKRALLLAFLGVWVATVGAAQDRTATLADIREQLTILASELGSLKRELTTTGDAQGVQQGGGPLERLDQIEREVRQLTAATEELEFRIDRIVQDGTNRLGDLEFRLVELEGGDLGQVGAGTPLGGEQPKPRPPAPKPDETAELAVSERGDFEAAVKLLDDGTPADAYTALTDFVATYPRSPLTAEAHLFSGEALTVLGNLPDAGRSYLDAYTLSEKVDPGLAAEALFKLGRTLAKLDQVAEACVTLAQVSVAFPGTTAASDAQTALAGLTCG